MKIMVVEDEIIIGISIVREIETLGHTSFGPIDSAEEAIACYSIEKPDLIMMDIFLNGEKNGVDAAKEILSKNQVPIVFVTASTDPITIESATSIEGTMLLKKPYSKAELQKVVSQFN